MKLKDFVTKFEEAPLFQREQSVKKPKIEWGDVGIAPYTVTQHRQNVGANLIKSFFG